MNLSWPRLPNASKNGDGWPAIYAAKYAKTSTTRENIPIAMEIYAKGFFSQACKPQ